jgi:hypothetical protein
MSAEVAAAANELRDFMFENVYLWEGARREAARACGVVSLPLRHYLAHPDEITSDFVRLDDPPGAGGRLRRRHDRPIRQRTAADWDRS